MTNNQAWPARIADRLEAAHPSGVITVASGISPSGPIHMGNLREVMTGAFVAQELRRRGREVRHILSWDDYDRFRKVPAGVQGVTEEWATYIGMPLSEVPAPEGSSFATWAEHFKAPFRSALAQLQVTALEEISQSEAYKAGRYYEQIVLAINSRRDLAEILVKYQIKGDDQLLVDDYYPFKPYCGSCWKDTTTVTKWDAATHVLDYSCSCGYTASETLETVAGKLVWKVDWPMRWAFESVNFEPAGRDHMSPGSSWTVGDEIVKIFGGERPLGQAYSFVGIDGQAKMASSKGGAPTPGELLHYMSPAIMRWLYLRSRPEQAFSIDMGQVSRLHDEFDAFTRKLKEGRGKDFETYMGEVIFNSTSEELSSLILPTVKFSAWVSFADMTMGDETSMEELARADGGVLTPTDLARAGQAIRWVERYMPEEERTRFSEGFREDFFENMTEEQQAAVKKLAEGLSEHWEELTRWSFGVPKLSFGYTIDERNLSPEAKSFQQEYFRNVYQLLVGEDKGGRLPSLMRCLGLERTRELLGMM